MSGRATYIVQKKTMQPHRTDERQVHGVEGGCNGQDETSVVILTKQTKLKTVTKSKEHDRSMQHRENV